MEPVVRVVVAEAAAAPGPLHYLLEGEGFQILGCASDDVDLARLLSQSMRPDVIVIDAEVPAESVVIAREFAPDSELIVVWPDGVTPPAWADRVPPALVFQDLGTAVYRAADRSRLRHPVADESLDLDDEAEPEPERPEPSSIAARRTAARVLVGTVSLIAAIVVTMGVSFALEGYRASHLTAPSRTASFTPTPSVVGRSTAPGSAQTTPGGARPSNAGCDSTSHTGPNAHASNHAQHHAADCPSQAGGGGPNGGHGNGHSTGSGQPSGSQSGGQGSGTGTGGGSGSGGGASQRPSDHPSGPPATPGAGHTSPKG
jgi:hypothetical protein